MQITRHRLSRAEKPGRSLGRGGESRSSRDGVGGAGEGGVGVLEAANWPGWKPSVN